MQTRGRLAHPVALSALLAGTVSGVTAGVVGGGNIVLIVVCILIGYVLNLVVATVLAATALREHAWAGWALLLALFSIPVIRYLGGQPFTDAGATSASTVEQVAGLVMFAIAGAAAGWLLHGLLRSIGASGSGSGSGSGS